MISVNQQDNVEGVLEVYPRLPLRLPLGYVTSTFIMKITASRRKLSLLLLVLLVIIKR